jgi:hypothetical protein
MSILWIEGYEGSINLRMARKCAGRCIAWCLDIASATGKSKDDSGRVREASRGEVD